MVVHIVLDGPTDVKYRTREIPPPASPPLVIAVHTIYVVWRSQWPDNYSTVVLLVDIDAHITVRLRQDIEFCENTEGPS